MLSNVEDIFDLGQQILSIVNEVYAEHGVALPNRQYIAAGDASSIPHDCDQVVVSFGVLRPGLPGDATPPVNCHTPTNAVFVVEIARPIPRLGATGGTSVRRSAIPEPNDIMETTRVQMIDARLLSETAKRCGQASWPEIVSPPYSVTVGPPSGGYQGVVMEVNLVV